MNKVNMNKVARYVEKKAILLIFITDWIVARVSRMDLTGFSDIVLQPGTMFLKIIMEENYFKYRY